MKKIYCKEFGAVYGSCATCGREHECRMDNLTQKDWARNAAGYCDGFRVSRGGNASSPQPCECYSWEDYNSHGGLCLGGCVDCPLCPVN